MMKATVCIILAFIGLLAGCSETQEEKIQGLLREIEVKSWDDSRDSASELEDIGKPAVPYLLKALKSESADVRGCVIQILCTMNVLHDIDQVAACREIVPLLDDADDNVRAQAARALGLMGERRAVKRLIELLKDSNKWVRQQAAGALGDLRETGAAGPLIEVLETDNDYMTRSHAAEALGELREKSAIPALAEALGHGHYQVRNEVAEALREIGEDSYEHVVKVLKTGNDDGRWYAALILAGLKGKSAVKPLCEALKDKYPLVREAAAKSLGSLGFTEAVGPLISLLADDNYNVRGATAEALGKLRDEKAVPALAGVLENKLEKWHVRVDAAVALGEIGDGSAVPSLIRALKCEHSNIRGCAAKALGEIGDASAAKALIDALETTPHTAAIALGQLREESATVRLIELWKKGYIGPEEPKGSCAFMEMPQARLDAAYALFKITGDRKYLKNLVDALKSNEWYEHRCAAELLGMLRQKSTAGPLVMRFKERAKTTSDVELQDMPSYWEALANMGELAVEPLMSLLDDKNELVRFRTVGVLSSICDKRAVEPLIERLSDESEHVRRQAADALGDLGDCRAVEPLVRIIEGGGRGMLYASAISLGKLGDKRAVGPLVELLRHRTGYVRGAAAKALRKLTNQDFGFDYDKWKAWHKKNKDK